jgi:NADH-quinone oxidoreductase subunit L
MTFALAPLIVLLPLLGAAANLVFSGRVRAWNAGAVASAAAGSAFAAAAALCVGLAQQPNGAVIPLLTWIEVAGLRVDWALRIDTLSVTMMLIVTGVGTLIHIYAIGYMHGDERYARFFVYLNAFLTAMLILVAADNYVMLFLGWEGVGLCSFLLIGFWFDKPNGEGWRSSSAARKALLVNRVGDAGFMLALLLIGTTFGTFDFGVIFDAAPAQFALNQPTIVLLTLLLTLGAAAKSAQIPLFVWLPDAMAGPTPVSALIHAATMVTAGVYLVARSHVLYALAPFTQEIVIAMGALTALLGASAALAQFDIKRVLAYSTISQLGFMMTAAGMGAYSAALFHLTTHAFFKALLFLAAGSVVHALGHGGDMRAMGGLRSRMPVTFAVFVIGGLALAGVPPLAGFFSKDEILSHAWALHPAVFLVLSASAALTAFYIGRQIMLVFFGAPHSDSAASAHESPPLLTLPLLVLAALACGAGALNLPGGGLLSDWLHYSINEHHPAVFEPAAALISLALSIGGLLLAAAVYGRAGQRDDTKPGRLLDLLRRAWGINDLYEQTLARLYDRAGGWLARADDSGFRDLDARLAGGLRRAAALIAPMETRQLNWNAAAVVVGLLIVLAVALWTGGR